MWVVCVQWILWSLQLIFYEDKWRTWCIHLAIQKLSIFKVDRLFLCTLLRLSFNIYDQQRSYHLSIIRKHSHIHIHWHVFCVTFLLWIYWTNFPIQPLRARDVNRLSKLSEPVQLNNNSEKLKNFFFSLDWIQFFKYKIWYYK